MIDALPIDKKLRWIWNKEKVWLRWKIQVQAQRALVQVPNLHPELGLRGEKLKNKVVIITAILVPESREKTDEELEADIKAELNPKDIP